MAISTSSLLWNLHLGVSGPNNMVDDPKVTNYCVCHWLCSVLVSCWRFEHCDEQLVYVTETTLRKSPIPYEEEVEMAILWSLPQQELCHGADSPMCWGIILKIMLIRKSKCVTLTLRCLPLCNLGNLYTGTPYMRKCPCILKILVRSLVDTYVAVFQKNVLPLIFLLLI